MLRRILRSIALLALTLQVVLFTAAAAAARPKCLVWVWIDGWRCAL